MDCSQDRLAEMHKMGKIAMLMTCRLNRSLNLMKERPFIGYQSGAIEPDPLPGPSLLDTLASEQHGEVCTTFKEMVDDAPAKGLPSKYLP